MLHFVDGERYKFVEVQIIDDAVPEGPERFQLILSKPSPGLELGTNTTGTDASRIWFFLFYLVVLFLICSVASCVFDYWCAHLSPSLI